MAAMKSEAAPESREPGATAVSTPAREDSPVGPYAAYVPHDIPYNATFEDSVMDMIAAGDVSCTLPDYASISEAVNADELPSIRESDLPLPLADTRRIFPSPIPGLRLTHPGGYFEGGPGLDPEMDTFVEDFVERNPDINANSDEDALRKAILREIDQNMEVLKERVSARRRAHERNEQIDKDLEIMSDQHSMEMKINRRLADERRAKKEAKERRRRGER